MGGRRVRSCAETRHLSPPPHSQALALLICLKEPAYELELPLPQHHTTHEFEQENGGIVAGRGIVRLKMTPLRIHLVDQRRVLFVE